MSRISRLFELIGILRARRTPATAQALADDLGISPRSVYRDIETLRALGAPIDGQAGIGYRLREGFFLPPLAFSTEELDVLILALGWVRERADPALAQTSDSALAKIMAARRDAAPPENAPALIAPASITRSADPPHVALLRDAIRRQRKVDIRYADKAGTPSERVIWPIAIVHFDDVRLLAAWCERRSAFRHFRTDRIEAVAVSDDRYPGRRAALFADWRAQDRDWRTLLTKADDRGR